MAELLLQCSEFDLDSLKLSNPADLMDIGIAEGPTIAIVATVREHNDAEVEVEAATARLHQAELRGAQADAELGSAPRRIVLWPHVSFLVPDPDPCCCSSARRPERSSRNQSPLCKPILYGAFVWARGALKHQKRRWSPARADDRIVFQRAAIAPSPHARGARIGPTAARRQPPARVCRHSLS